MFGIPGKPVSLADLVACVLVYGQAKISCDPSHVPDCGGVASLSILSMGLLFEVTLKT